MGRFTLIRAQRNCLRVLLCAIVAGVFTSSHSICLAGDEANATAVQPGPPPTVRSGGLLEESFNYHRQPPMQPAVATAGYPSESGWYGYGFPVQSYRWGWFGAERHYPRVMWHEGYYGDTVRTAYRYGN